MARCPQCRRDAPERARNPAFPFCSERCKAIDLGKWFGGEYRVPGPPVSPDELPATGPEDELELEAVPPPRTRRH